MMMMMMMMTAAERVLPLTVEQETWRVRITAKTGDSRNLMATSLFNDTSPVNFKKNIFF